MKWFFLLLGFTAVSLTSVPTWSYAASLYLDPSRHELFRGDAVLVSVRIDVDKSVGECVNAFDVVLQYDEGIIPVDVSIGRSIISMWVETPTIDIENRLVTFAGGIPNGYCGRVDGDPRLTNVLAEISFRAPGMQVGGISEGEIMVGFAPETSVYLNDGLGTRANAIFFDAQIDLRQTVGSIIKDPWLDIVNADNIPPEPFEISLEKGTTEFNGKYYIVFNTTDKQTGISHYEVLEEYPDTKNPFAFGAATAPWREVRSPYVLKDQSLRSTIRVRAIDKAGNQYIATLAPQNTARSVPLVLVIVLSIVLILLAAALSVWYYRRRQLRLREQIKNS